MERLGHLDPSNNIDLFCLHYLATPLLRSAAERFVLAWNNHGIRTEGELTPLQLFSAGLENLKKHSRDSGEYMTELDQV